MYLVYLPLETSGKNNEHKILEKICLNIFGLVVVHKSIYCIAGIVFHSKFSFPIHQEIIAMFVSAITIQFINDLCCTWVCMPDKIKITIKSYFLLPIWLLVGSHRLHAVLLCTYIYIGSKGTFRPRKFWNSKVNLGSRYSHKKNMCKWKISVYCS